MHFSVFSAAALAGLVTVSAKEFYIAAHVEIPMNGGQGFPNEYFAFWEGAPICSETGILYPATDDVNRQNGVRCSGCGAGAGGDKIDVEELEWNTQGKKWGHHTFYKNRDGAFVDVNDVVRGHCGQTQLLCRWLEDEPEPEPEPEPTKFKGMFVGDSITHGYEGDFTWRYRLWEWLDAQNVAAEFVGPHSGTKPAESAAKAYPKPPELEGEPTLTDPVHTDGEYAKDVSSSFSRNHCAVWGWQAAQIKNEIADIVSAHKPDYLLLLAGFNDLGWWVSGPEGTLQSIKSVIDNARKSNPSIKILVGNVVQRTLLSGVNDELPAKTSLYNALLASAVPGWSTSSSPIRLVDVASNYNCRPEGCPHGYDGLHPNSDGEFAIAQAFSRVLYSEFHIGSGPITTTNGPKRTASTPSNFKVTAVPEGIEVSWDSVFGARSYDYRAQRQTFGWSQLSLPYNGWWETWVVDDEEWSFQVRTSMGDGDENKSPWTTVKTVKAHPETTPGPPNVITKSMGGGQVYIGWDQVDVPGFDRFGVIVYDTSVEGGYPVSYGTRSNSIVLNDLVFGHQYAIAVQVWTGVGGGFPSAGAQVIV
ncbi:SGNH hydrolase-type esterase domain-containing protein [Aspergillus spectabilis]